MRRLSTFALVISLGALAASCGKSGGESSTAPSQPAKPAPTAADMKAAQASLPAPYNTADLTNGAAKFALCASCHSIAPDGPNLTGPHLHGVVGRKAGSLSDYNYSDPLKASGIVWDGASLDRWLTDPRADVPGTKMTFIGLKDAKDRTDIIAYLMVNK